MRSLPLIALLLAAATPAIAQPAARAGYPAPDEVESTSLPADAPSSDGPPAPSPVPAAATIPAPAPEPASALPARAPDAVPKRFGMVVETGVPEGLSVGLSFRPVPSIRLAAGPAWNVVAFGVQGGVAIVPFAWAVAPALSLDVGRYFGADLTRFVQEGTGAPQEVEPLLRDVSYDYAAAHLGVEIGARNGLAFSVRAGLAYVRVKARGRAESSSDGTEVYFVDPRLSGTVPSVKVGLQFSF